MITVKEAAQNWGLSIRRVQDLCKSGKIEGAVRFGSNWMIPITAKKPLDGRSKQKQEVSKMAMPKESILLGMTNLYNTPGTASKVSKELKENPNAKHLFDAEIAYYQGEIDRCIDIIHHASSDQDDLYCFLGKNFLLCQCAIWKGDLSLWNTARKKVSTISKHTQDNDIIQLTYAALFCSVHINPAFLTWFCNGNFERVPADMHPFAKVYYAKLNYLAALGVATKQLEFYDIKGLSLMSMISHTVEPMLTQAVVDRTIIPEIYLRLNCALSYRYSGNDNEAIRHLDRAISLALKDKLYGILAEFLYRYEFLLEQRLILADPEAARIIKELYQKYQNGWSVLSATLRNRAVATNLTSREREVSRLVSFGFTNKQIAKMLNVSEETIKSTVKNIMNKTGLTNRSDFYSIL